MAGSRIQSREEVVAYVQRSLGFPVVCVELTPEHFEDAVDDAEIWISSYIGQIRQFEIQMAGGVSEFDIPEDVEYIVDMAFPEKRIKVDLLLNPSAFADTNELPYSYYSTTVGGGFNSGLYQFLQYNDMTKRTLSADEDFFYDKFRKKLIVRPATGSGKAVVWYLSKLVDYDQMTIQAYMLLRRYSIARANYVLGTIRSKYSSVPAAGGTVSLNGSELVSNAQLEMSELLEAVRALAPPLPFLTG